MPTLYDPTRDELADLLDGEPKYRLDQLWSGLYTQFQRPSEITTLPTALRARLDAHLPESLIEIKRETSKDGQTVKFLWRLLNGNHPIETVLMYYDDRATVCISSQAGCAMACGFCATGQAGFSRHLTPGEIVEQVVRSAREASANSRRIDNIVFMGMGEPLANEASVWASVQRIHGDIGISARHITISTVGIVPGINALSNRELPVNLAVSLHAARNELRSQLVPINARYPIEMLIRSCQDYLLKKNRRISFEWAMIESVNDTERDARELAALCERLSPAAHVNLIPLNPTPGYLTQGSSEARVAHFQRMLRELGVNATTRKNRGTEIAAACGQLAAGQPITLKTPTKRRGEQALKP